MIYLSGAMQAEKIGLRKDLGVMIGYRSNGDFFGKTNRFHNCLFAIDNGCFTNPDINVENFLQWLRSFTIPRQIDENEINISENCLFAVAPDVVGNAEETIKRSIPVLSEIRKLGFSAAFVGQDGLENIAVPWDKFDCYFVGGSTEWKCSDSSFWLIREALKKGKWVHVGRVNSMTRILWARFAGAHSCDGTTIAFAPDKKLPEVEKWLDLIKYQPVLNF